MIEPLSRRAALCVGAAALAIAADEPKTEARPFLTRQKDFQDVSRGTPVPHSLSDDELAKAGLTEATWKLEITAEDGATMKATTLDFKRLLKIGEKKSVRYLKAMQCNNIALPLGQGLWEGVLLRDVLEALGPFDQARRLFYWGFHNGKPAQMFRSSLAMSQVLDGPPGDLPLFLAYKLNGEAITPLRGGPVRMLVPWAHGFKSVKWLQRIVLTGKYEANDTYALAGNDPESYLKTAAYYDDPSAMDLAAGKPFSVRGTAMVGWPGLERVEWQLDRGEWKPATIDAPPKEWGFDPKGVHGFDGAGKPKEWPMRFSVAHWTLRHAGLKAGKYELRIRSVDRNGIAQPGPRRGQKSGRNLIQMKRLTVA